MKVLTVDEAQRRLDAMCAEALAGEIVRLQTASGALLELVPVTPVPAIAAVPPQQLAECYEDSDWAAFERQCGRASD